MKCVHVLCLCTLIQIEGKITRIKETQDLIEEILERAMSRRGEDDERRRRKRKRSTEEEEVATAEEKEEEDQVHWIDSDGHSECGGGPHSLCPAHSVEQSERAPPSTNCWEWPLTRPNKWVY